MRKNSGKDWNDGAKCAINEARPEGAGNTDEPLDINQTLGGPVMPDYVGNIGSDESASNTSKDNWQSIGDLTARLAAKAEYLPKSESLIDYEDNAGCKDE